MPPEPFGCPDSPRSTPRRSPAQADCGRRRLCGGGRIPAGSVPGEDAPAGGSGGGGGCGPPGAGPGAAALPAPCYSFSRRETFGRRKVRGSGRAGAKAESRLGSGWGEGQAGDAPLQGWGECAVQGLPHLLQQQSPYIRGPFLAPPFTHVPLSLGLAKQGGVGPCSPCAG